MTLFLHAAAVSLAATQAGLERYGNAPAVRHALEPGLVDPRAMTFRGDDADFARIRGALLAHVQGDETRIVLSCSVYNGFAKRLAQATGIAVERSDDAGARAAVTRGSVVGLAVSYPPSYAIVETHVEETAAAEGIDLTIVPLMAENAFAFAGDADRYRDAVVSAARAARGIDAIFLAQFSMDPYAPLVAEATDVPIVSALEACLERLCRAE